MSKQSIEASAHREGAPTHATLDDWIAREATPFSVDSPRTFNAAVDKVIASLGDSVELLGFGEALHGGEDILILRNRLFQRLVDAHGYNAIAIESSFPRACVANEYVAGRGGASYEAVQDAGFSHGFGRLDANRELVEWMRRYNWRWPTRRSRLVSRRRQLHCGSKRKTLTTELWARRPELVAQSGESRYAEALHYASVARQLLNYHAAVARKSGPAGLLGMRDASMADNLAYMVSRERGRGKVLAFAHNRHLQRGKAH